MAFALGINKCPVGEVEVVHMLCLMRTRLQNTAQVSLHSFKQYNIYLLSGNIYSIYALMI